MVLYNNNLYNCTTKHTSTSFNADIANWELIGTITIYTSWKKQTLYLKDQIVYYDNVPYICNNTHISGASFSADSSNFDMIYSNIRNYAINTYYKEGSTVVYNKKLYKCIKSHTSSSEVEIGKYLGKQFTGVLPCGTSGSSGQISVNKEQVLDLGSVENIESIYWEQSGGYAGISEFDVSVSSDGTNYTKVYYYHNASDTFKVYSKARYIKFHVYTVNSLGLHGSVNFGSINVYITRAKEYWELINDTNVIVNDWKPNTHYEDNQLVMYNNLQYVCVNSHVSGTTFDKNNWRQISGSLFIWNKNTQYYENDLVYYSGYAYKCKVTHKSGTGFETDKFDPIYGNIKKWIPKVHYDENTQVLYNNKLYECVISNNDDYFVEKNWKPIARTIELWRGSTDPTLKALLHFDDTVTRDEVGNKWSSIGTLAVNPHQHVFKTGSSLGISTTSSYIEYPTFKDFYTSTGSANFDCTISFWLNTSSNASNIIEILGIKLNPTSFTQYVVGKWNHIEIDISGGVKKFYINGNFVGSDTNATYTNTTFKIGILDSVSEIAYIDDLSIYNKVLHTTDFSVPTERTEVGKYYDYDIGDYVEHNHVIYRCIEANNDLLFDAKKWEAITTITTVDNWKPTTDYSLHEVVVNSAQLLRCTMAHRSDSAFTNTEETYWEVLGGSIGNWLPNTQYALGNIVLYQDSLYRCVKSHVSGKDFSDTYFIELRSSSTSNNNGAYKQLTRMDVVAPKKIDIFIQKTKSFKLPPVEILKLNPNISNSAEISFFDDGKYYIYNKDYVTFDGVAKLITDYNVPITKSTLGTSTLIQTTDYIDTSLYKTIKEINTTNSSYISFKAIPKPQIIKDKNLKPVGDYAKLNSITLNCNLSGGADIRLAITLDGSTYYVYNANSFIKLDLDKDFATLGMTPKVFASIPITDIEAFLGDNSYIGFAYYLDMKAFEDVAELDSVLVNSTSDNWKKAIHGTDYDYSYTSQRTLQVDLLTDGSYKINYANPDADDNIESDWATKRQARGYAISLG